MIPPKIFMRMTDLLAIDARNMQNGRDRSAEKELDHLQEQYGWPQNASPEQRQEWEDLYSRLDLKDFQVCYLEEPGDDMDWTFECQAEDEAHAKEQCEDAYPGCVVLHVSPVDSEVKP